MNIRIEIAGSDALRMLAAVAHTIMCKLADQRPYKPDLADFEELMAPYVEKVTLMAKIQQGKISPGGTYQQVLELQGKLDAVEVYIAEHPL